MTAYRSTRSIKHEHTAARSANNAVRSTKGSVMRQLILDLAQSTVRRLPARDNAAVVAQPRERPGPARIDLGGPAGGQDAIAARAAGAPSNRPAQRSTRRPPRRAPATLAALLDGVDQFSARGKCRVHAVRRGHERVARHPRATTASPAWCAGRRRPSARLGAQLRRPRLPPVDPQVREPAHGWGPCTRCSRWPSRIPTRCTRRRAAAASCWAMGADYVLARRPRPEEPDAPAASPRRLRAGRRRHRAAAQAHADEERCPPHDRAQPHRPDLDGTLIAAIPTIPSASSWSPSASRRRRLAHRSEFYATVAGALDVRLRRLATRPAAARRRSRTRSTSASRRRHGPMITPRRRSRAQAPGGGRLSPSSPPPTNGHPTDRAIRRAQTVAIEPSATPTAPSPAPSRACRRTSTARSRGSSNGSPRNRPAGTISIASAFTVTPSTTCPSWSGPPTLSRPIRRPRSKRWPPSVAGDS